MVTATSTGPNLRKLIQKIEAQASNKKAQAVLALANAVDHGTLEIQDALEAATTKTGLARERYEDGFPGRHRSGNMVGSISNNTHAPEFEGPRVIMAMGWFPEHFQQYFVEQDKGIPGQIPAALAGFAGFDLANRIMVEHLTEWQHGDLEFDD